LNGVTELRRLIDENNEKLLDLLSERGALVSHMRNLKEKKGEDLFDPRREHEMLERLIKANQGPFPDEVIRSLFKEVFKASLGLMSRKTIESLRVYRSPGAKDKVIDVSGVTLGRYPQYIAGPCSVEGLDELDAVAAGLSRQGVRLLRGGAYKPRTSPYSFQGMGEEGLRILEEVATRHGMVSVTEVLDTRSAELVAAHAGILQIGTRNMSNFELLKEVGRIGKPVLLKRGFMATLDEFLNAAEYIMAAGNNDIILCERGIRTFVKSTRNTLDISAVPLLKKNTYLPVIVDVSHAVGRKDLLEPLAAAAFAAGADGVMIEVHHDPLVAKSDAEQQLTVNEFAALAESVRRIIPGAAPAPVKRMEDVKCV